ncbi:alpha/beta hydrolase [Aliikangiella sp. IMCC44632]
MKKICNLLIVVLWMIPALAHSKNKLTTFEFKLNIESKHLSEIRPFHIQLPKSYYKNKLQDFPVLYVLDSDNLQRSATFTQNILASKQHIPEMIIVSVPHTGERTRDFSPYFRYNEQVNLGANQFMSFIKEELLPFIDKHYRTTNYRVLSGHSKSGLFVIHSLIQEQELFRARFAFSPSLHHTPKLQQDIVSFLKSNSELNSYLYMNHGDSEFFKIKDAINLATKNFRELSPKGLRHRFDVSDVDGHQTTPHVGFHIAFKDLYKPHKLDFGYSDMSFTEVLQHFKSTSKEFGYVVKPSVKELQSITFPLSQV